MHHIVITLLHQYSFSVIRVSVLRDVCNQCMGLGIKMFEVFMIRNTNRIKSLSRNSYRRNNVHPIMKNDLSVLVCTVTEFVHLIG